MRTNVSDSEIAESYATTKSVWKTAEIFGLSGQSVHSRLIKLGIARSRPRFSDSDKRRLTLDYKKFSSSGTLQVLASEMGRTKNFICRQAGFLGLTDKNIKRPYSSDAVSKRVKRWIKDHGHPRGHLGMKHSDEMKKATSKRVKKWWRDMPEEDRYRRSMAASKRLSQYSAKNRTGTSWKAAWREIGGVRKYFRSRWEANYAYYLQWLKTRGEIISWLHEPETFWFDGIRRGCLSYLPDFRVIKKDGATEYHEVKGWMDARSITKIKRMAKYHPKVKIIVIDGAAYRQLTKAVGQIVPGWEQK